MLRDTQCLLISLGESCGRILLKYSCTRHLKVSLSHQDLRSFTLLLTKQISFIHQTLTPKLFSKMTGGETAKAAGHIKTLPKVLEELARDYPDSTWMNIPNDSELSQGYRAITYRELAAAVNGMTRWIGRLVGIGRRSTDIAAYIGTNDARYAVAQIGLMKAGYMTMLPSPRNSADGQRSLFQTTKCNLLLHSEGMDTHVETIKATLPGIQTLQIPSFDELSQQGSQFPLYAGPYNDKDDDRVVVLHTSGSTGLPKPIYHTNASIWTFAILKDLPAPIGRRSVQNVLFESDQPLLTVAPFFHSKY